ncbi:Fic family protein [Patescibacteria group bacterium]|nr:MAG: Fic family protein [Patescibacteria group bacterium]
MTNEEIEFLKESNAIEREYSDKALQDAIKAWQYLKKQDKLTDKVVLRTHELLTKRIMHPDASGRLRQCKVYIGGREGMEWRMIPDALDEWCKDANTSAKVPGIDGKHIKIDHVAYEKIHPFVDGNGRTGRMFLNWARIKAGLPILIIHEGAEQYEYYKWFEDPRA